LRGKYKHLDLMSALMTARSQDRHQYGAGKNLKALRSAARKKQLLTTSQAAGFAGYTQDHVGLLLRRGLLSGIKTGRDWIVTAEDVLKYVETNPRPGRSLTETGLKKRSGDVLLIRSLPLAHPLPARV
jgi:hypothetical protein